MKEVEFEALFTLKVTLNDDPLGEIESTYEGMVKTKTFITEFFKHPTAVLSYYRSGFIDEYINDSADDLEVLEKHLNYLPDYGPLFIEIAKNCPPEVAEFIENIFAEDGEDKNLNIKRELDRQILEDELRTLKVVDASFKMLQPPLENLATP